MTGLVIGGDLIHHATTPAPRSHLLILFIGNLVSTSEFGEGQPSDPLLIPDRVQRLPELVPGSLLAETRLGL